ncbi:MAG: 4Fe-4S binding protein [Bacteroidetes bacterium]|nr:4Fe-4S binding protein [Bacteroidota bacterium]MBT5529272.1 4Fe-4S binding protein [Cytophagia bacterium]MBT3423785.1 4Fe-4S binding protein [Bacteroidota bacterium]MBT3932711.1 4Fe-4S binding protein [Bacteroidota bacterium]MBT4340336.1 4Fe-4S binding protein [Bacteroidota bacterium]
MNKIKHKINLANISRFRTIIQILSFILIMYGGYAAITISERIPTFACPYATGSAGTCYLIAMQHGLHITWADFASYRGFGFYTGLLIFLAWFIVFNKSWCGFVCPLGSIQDWITKLRKLLGIAFTKYDSKLFKKLRFIKFIVLGLLILIPLGMSNSLFGLPHFSHDLGAPFCQICPGRTVLPLFTGSTSELFIDFANNTTIFMSTLGIIIFVTFIIGSFFKKRFFCFFCPMSALQFLFSRIGLLRMTKVGSVCTKCGNCSRVCDIGIEQIAEDITSKFIVKDDCMMCFKCVEACPENDCLKVSFAGISILNSTDEGFFKRYSDSKTFKIDTDSKELIDQKKKND